MPILNKLKIKWALIQDKSLKGLIEKLPLHKIKSYFSKIWNKIDPRQIFIVKYKELL
jgi:hypothetical protein